MKTLLTMAALGLVQLTSLAQGTIQFNNSTAGHLTKVYMPDGATSYPFNFPDLYLYTGFKVGNTTNDSIPGTQVYTGALLAGSTFTAQIFSAPGSGQPESSLVGQTTTTFRTGIGAGRFAATTATLANVVQDAAVATIQIRVFPSSYGTWANTLAAYHSGTDRNAWIGKSILFDVHNIGGLINTPPVMDALTSFNLGAYADPEPTAAALTGVGSVILFLFRHRKTIR